MAVSINSPRFLLSLVKDFIEKEIGIVIPHRRCSSCWWCSCYLPSISLSHNSIFLILTDFQEAFEESYTDISCIVSSV
ncbi:hypothetical protein L6452_26884 [Arctium lappa]|uniref:Uncharacterized protein n=1 Tax=Arctium lappa TaxID=4217 RepID=A0ACB8ZZS0_ARCLA|nr:hypothetical protein L6452_26884 [Arctium lappa]